MDLYYKQEVTVGLLVLAAATIFIVGLMWLTNSSLIQSGRTEIEIEFSEVNGLKVGDPVHVSGYNVGKVGAIALRGVGDILVRIEVPEAFAPREDAAARVASLDFLGAKLIAYDPGTGAPMGDDRVIAGTVERGVTDGMGGMMDQASAVMTGLQSFLAEETVVAIRETMDAAQRAMLTIEDVGNGPAYNEAIGALQSMRGAAERLDSLLASESLNGSVDRIGELTQSFQDIATGMEETTGAIGSILTRIENGEGTLGRALTDSTLHQDLHELMSSMRMLLDDMRERPGRYFRLTVF